MNKVNVKDKSYVNRHQRNINHTDTCLLRYTKQKKTRYSYPLPIVTNYSMRCPFFAS